MNLNVFSQEAALLEDAAAFGARVGALMKRGPFVAGQPEFDRANGQPAGLRALACPQLQSARAGQACLPTRMLGGWIWPSSDDARSRDALALP